MEAKYKAGADDVDAEGGEPGVLGGSFTFLSLCCAFSSLFLRDWEIDFR